jgi:hypothetical protein
MSNLIKTIQSILFILLALEVFVFLSLLYISFTNPDFAGPLMLNMILPFFGTLIITGIIVSKTTPVEETE